MLNQGRFNQLSDELYSPSLNYINEGDAVLNLGCGCLFTFEKVLTKNRSVTMHSADIVECDSVPDFVDRFLLHSVEDFWKARFEYNVVLGFELMEHLDRTDLFFVNSYKLLKSDGYLIFSFPNLASIYGRVELLLGLQPHILEVSNEKGTFGQGVFGQLNNPSSTPLHHIRGITTKAMREMVEFHNFEIIKVLGHSHRHWRLWRPFPSLAPLNIFICKKKPIESS